jgi:hypothetical protein
VVVAAAIGVDGLQVSLRNWPAQERMAIQQAAADLVSQQLTLLCQYIPAAIKVVLAH